MESAIINLHLNSPFLIMWSQLKQSQNEQVTEKESILAHLDQLPLGKWHIFVALALGLVWVFDGYEVTLISLYRHEIEMSMSASTFTALVSAYQFGCIAGSLLFGATAFVLGRRIIFLTTLLIYFVGVMLSGLQTSAEIFILSRFLTGISVGGEFTAIFTAVDQFLPPRYRGRVNIGIDGTWHFGGAVASLLTMLVGETDHWRLMFLVGWVGIASLFVMRRNVPESPRWLLLNHRPRSATAIVLAIQATVLKGDTLLDEIPDEDEDQAKEGNGSFCGYLINMADVVKVALRDHTRKCVVSFSLIFCQSFFFSQIYNEYPLILSDKFGMGQQSVSKYMLPISLINFISTLLIGPFFDEIGRRVLILITYGSAAVLVVFSYQLEDFYWREAVVILAFLFASPASSSANLISSEIFPTGSRTIMLCIMFMNSMLGGMVGVLVNNYLISAGLMILAAVIAFIFCPNAERKTLEEIEKM